MLPAEQPARTMAPAVSAAARARLGAGRCERDINIMPIRSRPDGNAKRRPAPPLHGKIAASSSNWGQVVCPHYGNSVNIKRLAADWGPKAVQIHSRFTAFLKAKPRWRIFVEIATEPARKAPAPSSAILRWAGTCHHAVLLGATVTRLTMPQTGVGSGAGGGQGQRKPP